MLLGDGRIWLALLSLGELLLWLVCSRLKWFDYWDYFLVDFNQKVVLL